MITILFMRGYERGMYPDWLIALVFFGPIVLGLTYLIRKEVLDRKWKKGIFPPDLEMSRDNLMEAYICLAAYMIQRDSREPGEKMRYIATHFHKHFPNHEYNIVASLKWSYHYPIQPKTVATWINRHHRKEGARLTILHFLAGLAFTDGYLIEAEYKILKDITPLLGLTQQQLDAVINMYLFKEEKTQEQKTAPNTSSGRRIQALTILELSANASDAEIKAAYRRLVKIHHPDRLSNASEILQKSAKERFLLIQEAYEYLSK